MRVRLVGFGCVDVDGSRYDHDIVIDGGAIRKRNKKASKPYRADFGHTPLSIAEQLPWNGPRLIIGTGVHGALPITSDVLEEAKRRGIAVDAVPTAAACRLIYELAAKEVNAVLHVTC